MKKDHRVFLDDIIESCSRIENYSKGIRKEKFEKNIELQDAITRRLEIIGEAVKRLPKEFREEHPNIAWKKATGMRDIIIHAYDEVDLNQVWKTIIESIPPFKKQIEELLVGEK